MGFFDFLSSPKQDVGDLQKEQLSLRKKKVDGATPFAPTDVPDDEGARLSTHLSEEAAGGVGEGVPPEQKRRDFAFKEQDLLKREARIWGRVKELALDPDVVIRRGDTSKEQETYKQVDQFRNALAEGKLTPKQALSDLDILIKKDAFQFRGGNYGVSKKAELYGLKDALAGVVDERNRFDLEPRPPVTGPQVDVASLEENSKELFDKASKIREEAQNLGVLSQGDRLNQARLLESQAASLKKAADAEKDRLEKLHRPNIVPEQDLVNQGKFEATPITDYANGLGINREDLMTRLHAAMVKVGIPAPEWESKVDPRSALLRVLSELDPQGNFAAMVSESFAKARAEDAAGAQGGRGQAQADDSAWKIEQAERKIQGREERMKMLYAQLRQSPFMSTWPGVILYVLVGLLTQNPAFAARLIGGVGNEEAIGNEIQGIQRDLSRLDREIEWRERQQGEAKREAARRMTRQGDILDQRMWELKKMDIQNRYIEGRSRKVDSQTESIIKKLEKEFDEVMSLSAKFSAGAKEPLNPKMKEDRAKFESYIRKAEELQATLRVLRGTNEKPIEEEVPAGVEDDE